MQEQIATKSPQSRLINETAGMVLWQWYIGCRRMTGVRQEGRDWAGDYNPPDKNMKPSWTFALALTVTAAGTSVPSRPVSNESGIQTIEGTISVVWADGVQAARIDRTDRSCLGVSLPTEELNKLKKSGPRPVSIRGVLMAVPMDIEVATVRVNGRLVGFKQCDNQYIFVKAPSDIQAMTQKSKPIVPNKAN